MSLNIVVNFVKGPSLCSVIPTGRISCSGSDRESNSSSNLCQGGYMIIHVRLSVCKRNKLKIYGWVLHNLSRWIAFWTWKTSASFPKCNMDLRCELMLVTQVRSRRLFLKMSTATEIPIFGQKYESSGNWIFKSEAHYWVDNSFVAKMFRVPPWSWKVLEFRKTIFQVWKVMENDNIVMEFLLLHCAIL